MIIASPTPQPGEMPLAMALTSAQPGDTIRLRGGDYPGTFDLRIAGVILEPYPGEYPTFLGPARLVSGTKPAWLHIWPSAAGAIVRNLEFVRNGDIADLWRAGWNDYGVTIEAPDVAIENCALQGMAKGIHVKGKVSTGCTIRECTIGPTIDSCVVVGTSYGVIRGLLIAENDLTGSYREDGIQFMQDFDAADPPADVSNWGVIIYRNIIQDCNENAIDLKGAGQVVIEGNLIERTVGSSNGAPDWNHNSPAAIMHGARTSTGHVIIRNNTVRNNSSGIRVYRRWYAYHNEVADNNYCPWEPYQGFGIAQMHKESAIKNNLVSGNEVGNLQLQDAPLAVVCNWGMPGPGISLTSTRGAGSGVVLPVVDAGYFTDWFGRPELSEDVIWLNGERYLVTAVDYDTNTLELDRTATWQDGEPVFWRSPAPTVGPLDEYVVPPVETVRLILETTMPPADAEQLRALLAGRDVKVSLG